MVRVAGAFTARRAPHGLLVLALLAMGALIVSSPLAALDVGEVVVLGTNSVHVQQNADVLSGDVVANTASAGPTLSCSGREMCIGIGVTTPAGATVQGDSVQVKVAAVVSGAVHYNSLLNNGSITGGLVTPLALPVLATLPAFEQEAPRPEADDVSLAIGETRELGPGDYGDVVTKKDSVLVFTGGVYNLESLDAGDNGRLEFLGPASVRVAGKLSTSQGGYVGSAAGAGVDASEIVFHVAGVNGTTGNLGASPKAAKIGIANEVAANFYVPNGTLHLRESTVATGAFFARDVDLGIGVTVSLASAFGNRAPTADPQEVYTSGAASLTIVLTGSDPDGDDLTFQVVDEPEAGELGPVVEADPPFPGDPPGCNPEVDLVCDPPDPPRTSATVVYTPDTGEDVEDSFTFQVSDPSGAIGVATVRINPPDDTTPPPDEVDTVVAFDGEVQTAIELAVEIRLDGGAPCDGLCDGVGDDVPLSFSIETAPNDGTLTDLTPAEDQEPQRSAFVTYTPDEDFDGLDSFEFEVCGEIESVETCDVGMVTVTVSGELADDQTVTTLQDVTVAITLGGTAGAGTKRFALSAKAAVFEGAAVGGAVADSDEDELGDNHNDLPGPVPVLASAAVDASGGPGSNGVARLQIEWSLAGHEDLAGALERAEVVLHTVKGTTDSLDTFFFAGTSEQDGLLTDSDFEAAADPIADVVLPVGEDPVGTEGTFTFDVTDLVRDALGELSYFSVQARVDEDLAGGGPARGLQVRTTADGNLTSSLEPQLVLTTPGVTFRVMTLPGNGTLRDASGTLISAVPTAILGARLTYKPDLGFSGPDSFTFEADDGINTAIGTIDLIVVPVFVDPCVAVGREPGCDPEI